METTALAPKETRASFLARLRPRIAPSDLLRVNIAYTISKYNHRAQVRKTKDKTSTPVRYFEHPREVALILMDELFIYDPLMVIAALIHDAVEDGHDVEGDVTPEMVELLFGSVVAARVNQLTKIPEEGYYERLMHADVATLIINGCDNLANLRTLKSTPIVFQKKQRTQSRQHIVPLLNRMVSITISSPWSQPASLLRRLHHLQLDRLFAPSAPSPARQAVCAVCPISS